MAELKIKVIFDTAGAIAATNNLEKATTSSWDKLAKALDGYRREAEKIVPTIEHHRVAVSRANYMLQAFNYTMRDAPYFAKDFALGILAIGNNLNPMIDAFIATKKAAEEANKSFMSILKESLSGGGGIILGFTLLVSALQSVVFWLDSTKSKNKELKSSLEDTAVSIREFTASFKEMGEVEAENAKQYADQLNAYREQVTQAEMLIRQGGQYVQGIKGAGEFVKFEPDQLEKIKNELEYAKRMVAVYESITTTDIQKNLSTLSMFIERLGKTATPQALINIKKELDLSNTQFDGIRSSLEWLRDHLFGESGARKDSIFGQETQKILQKLTLTKSEVENIIVLFDKLKDKQSEKQTRIKSDGFLTDTELEQQIRYYENLLAISKSENERIRILEKLIKLTNELYAQKPSQFSWHDIQSQINTIYPKEDILETLKIQRYSQGEMNTFVNELVGKDIEGQLTKNFGYGAEELKAKLDEIQQKEQAVADMASTIGDALVSAFRRGENVGEALQNLLEELIMRFLVFQGLAYILSGGTIGFFSGKVPFAQAFLGGKITPDITTMPEPPIPPLPNTPIQKVEIKGTLVGDGTSLKAVIDTESNIKRRYY